MDKVMLSAKNVGKKFRIYRDKPMTLKDRALSVIKKSYDDFWALKDVSLEVKKGEAIGLIGHNGCGKSTLLKLFSGIIYPNRGDISVGGRVSSLLELGAGFHPDFTGRENIYTNASVFGLSRNATDALLADIIEFSELGEFIDNPVRTYSSGMYMRLAFSVAVHVNPEILLIDEILAVGDSNFQKKCIDKILGFKRDGVTIIIVSHDLATVERICDRVVWLDDGAVRAQGSPKQVINSYLEHMSETRNEIMTAESAPPTEEPSRPENEIPDEEEKSRWGNKSVEISGVTLIDGNGKTRSVFDVEDSLTIRIHYKVNSPVDDVGFGIGIFGTDGIQRYGTNTYIDDIPVTADGVGTIECRIERIGLIAGSYRLDVAAHDRDGMPYDYILGYAEFCTSSPIRDVGTSRPPHRWVIQGVNNEQ